MEAGKGKGKRSNESEMPSQNKRPNDYYGPGSEQQWGKQDEIVGEEEENTEQKVKPNFGLTGALARDEVTGNMVNGVVLKWTEPMDAATPDLKWRFYVFKDEKLTETLHIHRKS